MSPQPRACGLRGRLEQHEVWEPGSQTYSDCTVRLSFLPWRQAWGRGERWAGVLTWCCLAEIASEADPVGLTRSASRKKGKGMSPFISVRKEP